MTRQSTNDTQTAQATASEEYARRRYQIDASLASLQRYLDAHKRKAEQDPMNWGLVGDLGHIATTLQQITDSVTDS